MTVKQASRFLSHARSELMYSGRGHKAEARKMERKASRRMSRAIINEAVEDFDEEVTQECPCCQRDEEENPFEALVPQGPAPAVALTGEVWNVEWDSYMGRYWQKVDSGELDSLIWYNRQDGIFLSDIEE